MTLWLAAAPLVLASSSSARRALLEAAGIPIEVRAADVDERSIEASAPVDRPGPVAELLAAEKARTIASACPGRLVVGADQTLALDDRRFSKPSDRARAREQLLMLSGRTHELHSAIVFVRDATVVCEHVGTARLTMRSFSDRFLDAYLEAVGSAATASVGAYHFEGPGIQLFERVEGDYFTILGLPLLTVLDVLRRYGYLIP